MKKPYVRTIRLLCAALSLLAASPSGARADDQTILAKVPFAFIVAHETMPAGSYVVTERPEDPNVVSIESADRRHFAFVLANNALSTKAPAQPRLVFEKIENQYVLMRILSPDGDERELAWGPTRTRLDEVKRPRQESAQ